MFAIRYSLVASICCVCCSAVAQDLSGPMLVTVEAVPLPAKTTPPLTAVPESDWFEDTPTDLDAVSIPDHAPNTTPSESAGCPICNATPSSCHGVCKDPGWPRKPLINKPGDRDRSNSPPKRYQIPDCKRAGHPHRIAPWAKCSVDGKYSSWFVGGGSPFCFGRPRNQIEGTWGLDYGGLFGHAKVWLRYTRFHRNQGGEGAYATDGEPAVAKTLHRVLHLQH